MANIDTLSYYKELIEAGNSEPEAVAHVYALSNGVKDLVTKDDLHSEIKGLENRLDTRLDSFETKIDAKFTTIKTLGWALFVCIAVPSLKFTLGL